jgi:tRNA 2-selenouridine synthase
MTEWASESQWQQHLLGGGTFLDVRAPVEFTAGALPGAANVPILDDQERHEVGLCYTEKGPEAATDLGHKLVSGARKDQRLEGWQRLAEERKPVILYCFRGGQRSRIAQSWLKETGIEIPRIPGGYKEVRQFFLSLLSNLPDKLKPMSLSGHTGSGKTKLLRELKKESDTRIIDLELLANHRGSAFGKEISPQPSQAQFENDLAVELWRMSLEPTQPVWFEDEARTIGKITLHDKFFAAIRRCPLVVIDEPQDLRAQIILEEYVVHAWRARQTLGEEAAWQSLQMSLMEPIHKITRKLGADRTAEALRMVADAMAISRNQIRFEAHLAWIQYLLEHYYDAYYELHMERQKDRIVFRGSRADVGQFIKGQR